MLRNQQTVARNTYSRVKYHFSSFNNFLFPCWWIESSRRTNDGPSSITDRSPSRITQPVKLRRENSDVDAPSRRGMTCTFCAHYSGFKIFELFIHNKNISCWSFTQRWLLTPVSIIIVCYDDDEMKRESKVVYIPSGLLAHVYNLFLFLFLGFFFLLHTDEAEVKVEWKVISLREMVSGREMPGEKGAVTSWIIFEPALIRHEKKNTQWRERE